MKNFSLGPKYFKEIDSLRAVAVLFVLFHHFFTQRIASQLLLGNVGVDIFFTLSGFLITGILLDYKEQLSFGEAIKKFYYRRTLRIFPVYYLYIVIAWLLYREVFTHTSLLAGVFYVVNFYTISSGLTPWPLGHFWSLCVEEQFYIVWPFLILLTPKKFIKSLMVFLIIASFVFTILNTLVFKVPYVEYMHSFSCVQALVLGGLLTYMQREKPESLRFAKRYNTALICLFSLFTILTIDFYPTYFILFDFIRITSAGLTFFVLVRLTSMEQRDMFASLARWKFLQFIGKISYGIYIYHLLVMMMLDPYFGQYSTLITFPLYTLITIVVAYMSFVLIEQPVNRLKNKWSRSKLELPVSEKNDMLGKYPRSL